MCVMGACKIDVKGRVCVMRAYKVDAQCEGLSVRDGSMQD